MHEVTHPDLSRLTTLGLGGSAQVLVSLDSLDDLERVEDRVRELGCMPLVLGRGSNILAKDGDLPLVLLKPAFPQTLSLVSEKIAQEMAEKRGSAARSSEIEGSGVGESEVGKSEEVLPSETVFLRVSASYPLQKLLVSFCHRGLSGLEGLAGIPGSVGGAVAMNAGSFGSTMGSCVHEVTLWMRGRLHTFSRDTLRFGYRLFEHPLLSLKGGDTAPLSEDFWILVDVCLALRRRDPSVVRAAFDANLKRKRETQPVSAKSAGCIFKNPPGDAAGRLLEAAGFKGKQLGGVAFSSLHANFLLNVHKGRAQEALELMEMAKEAVLRMSGCALQTEVRIVPWMLP